MFEHLQKLEDCEFGINGEESHTLIFYLSARLYKLRLSRVLNSKFQEINRVTFQKTRKEKMRNFIWN